MHSPAGLDIGGRTAAEIALSVLAELVSRAAGRRSGTAAGRGPAHHGVDPVCGMTVAAVDSSPHVTSTATTWFVLRGLPDRVPRRPGPVCRLDPGAYLP